MVAIVQKAPSATILAAFSISSNLLIRLSTQAALLGGVLKHLGDLSNAVLPLTGLFLVFLIVMNVIARNSHYLFVVFGFHEFNSVRQGWCRPWEPFVKLGVTTDHCLRP